MGVHRGENIVTNGLVAYWDSKNPKCYNTYNLLQFTEGFSAGYWADKINITVTSDAIIAPDGTLTADKISETATNGQHYIQNLSLPRLIGDTCTFSMFVKAAERTVVELRINENNTAFIGVAFDLVNGVVTNVDGSVKYTMLYVGDGWYRCSVTRTTAFAGSSFYSVFINQSSAYLGISGRGAYIWGAQLTRGNRVLPYQPNLTTLPLNTLVSDLMKINNGTLVNGTLVNASEGLYVFDGVNDNITLGNSNITNTNVFTLDMWVNFSSFTSDNLWHPMFVSDSVTVNGTTGYALYQNTASPYNKFATFVNTTAGVKGVQSATLLNINQWYMATLVYDQVNVSLYVNGILEAQVASTGNIIYPTTPAPGFGLANSSYFKGQIGMPKIYNRALTSAEVWQNYQATKNRFL